LLWALGCRRRERRLSRPPAREESKDASRDGAAPRWSPCWLRGANDLKQICHDRIHPEQHHVSADGAFSWEEVECIGACVNAPVLQIGKDYYEDLDGPATERILEALRRGETPKPGPQDGRHSSEPEGGALTLKDPKLYDGVDQERLGPALHQFHGAWQPQHALDQTVVKQGHAHFQRMGHAHHVGIPQKRIQHVAARFQIRNPVD